MKTLTKQKIIIATKEDIWKVLSNYGEVYKFNPGISKSHITSEQDQGVGATRICELLPVGKVSETITEWYVGSSFTLRVTPIEKLPPTENFYTHFKIEKLSVNTSRVSVIITYKMKLGITGKFLNKILIQPRLKKNITNLLGGLKAYMEKK